MKRISYVQVVKNLVIVDLLIFKQAMLNKCIDFIIWMGLTIFVTGYIMPYFGVSNDFGIFQLGGILAAIGLFELYTSVVDFVADLQGDRIIDYQVTLPIPSWLAITAKAIFYSIAYFSLACIMVPVGKVMLWTTFDLMQVNYIQLIIALLVQSIFCASFAIVAASLIDNMAKLGTVWSRCIFPMWFMGGFQFSWNALYQATPVVAWIDLINPMIFVTEATRVAILGQQGYLNFWLCIVATLCFSIICLYAGIWNLKRRLDYI